MRIALINPPWSFQGSIYCGCREPHLPLEYGYARALLMKEGHEVHIIDGQAQGLSLRSIREEVSALSPEMTVVSTAPSYLFWRSAPPELRVPMATTRSLVGTSGLRIAVGPHASTTPGATLQKLGVDAVVMGECEEVLLDLARAPRDRWTEVSSIAYRDGGEVRVSGHARRSDLARLPALLWRDEEISRHTHHHHRFDAAPTGPSAELEASRGTPYPFASAASAGDSRGGDCRRRRLRVVLEELDGLIAQGVRYVYFIDDGFSPNEELLSAIAARHIAFGVQLRIDEWSLSTLDRLGDAGCVSIEVGLENVTGEGRSARQGRYQRPTEEITELLLHAKRKVAFVQVNVLDGGAFDPAAVLAFRARLLAHGIWANEPFPLFSYPGSPDYTKRWGAPDDRAWERALEHYLGRLDRLSASEGERPLSISALESCALPEVKR